MNKSNHSENLLLLNEYKEVHKKLFRSTKRYLLGGVCGGLAKFANTDPILFRILFVAFTLLGGVGIFIYITLLLTLEPDTFNSNEVYLLKKEKERNFKVIIGSILILISLFKFLDFFTYLTGINLYFFNNMIALSLFLVFLGIVIFVKKVNFDFVNIYTLSSFRRKKIGQSVLGVCNGLSEYLSFNLNTIRMIWLLFAFVTLGFGAIVYMLIALTSNYKEENSIIEEI